MQNPAATDNSIRNIHSKLKQRVTANSPRLLLQFMVKRETLRSTAFAKMYTNPLDCEMQQSQHAVARVRHIITLAVMQAAWKSSLVHNVHAIPKQHGAFPESQCHREHLRRFNMRPLQASRSDLPQSDVKSL